MNFYRWFILGFCHIAWPLNQFMKGNGKNVFKWTLTQQQDLEQLKKKLCTTPVLVLLICIIPLRLRWMHHTMPSAHWSLSQVTQSRFIPRLSATPSEGTWRMKKNYMPLCKILSNGDTTFLSRKGSSSLTISLYSSVHPSQNYKQLNNSSGLITCNNFSW